MKTREQKNTRAKKQEGVALLFVVLLTSVLLLVAIGITTTSYKQIVFSLEAHDSDRAFFAADTGIECGLYLDKQGQFGGSGTDPSCNGPIISISSASAPIYTFRVANFEQCVEVTVDKAYMVGSVSNTKISAVGYNVNQIILAPDPYHCIPSTFPTARVVTRALSLHYPNPSGSGTGGGAGVLGVTTNTTSMGGTITGTGGSTITTVGVDYGSASGTYTDSYSDTYYGTTFDFSAGCSPVYYRAWITTDTGTTVYGSEQYLEPAC